MLLLIIEILLLLGITKMFLVPIFKTLYNKVKFGQQALCIYYPFLGGLYYINHLVSKKKLGN